MRKLAALALALSTTGFTSFALAHAGHGVTPPAGIVHYLMEPLHVIPALVTLAVLVIAIRAVWSRVR
jgi:alpha-beta hydrolase superfamily lysophospholipase